MKVVNKYERYQRQIVLKELGVTGQDKLFKSKVLVVGAGGLGCPALQYLAASGVGTIGIIDFDIVELSNLQRQTLYNIDNIGKPKALIVAEKLKAFNLGIQIISYNEKLTTTNALDILKYFDIVIDGSDNFATRYLVNDACVLLNKPLIYGAILRFEGQVAVFNLPDKKSGIKTNYRDLFPTPPNPSTVPSCNEAGVLGVLPGIIGTMQAAEAIKIITGIGEPLCNKIISYNVLNNSFYEFNISPVGNVNGAFPKNESEFLSFNYEWFCCAMREPLEITCADFEQLRKAEEISIIDVREIGEQPFVDDFFYNQVPLSEFSFVNAEPFIKNKIVLFCQSGKRSLKAAKMIKEKFPGCIVFSLKGGIEAWSKFHSKTLVE